MLLRWPANKIGGAVFVSYFFKRVLEWVNPVFADLYMEFNNIALSIMDKGNQTFAKHRVIPFAQECVVVPMFQPARHRFMGLQLDAEPVIIRADGCSP